MTPPNISNPAEIVSEINTLREQMGMAAQRIHLLSKQLNTQIRRTAVDSNTSAYLTYTTAWMRFTGALSQGLKRTASTDRVLQRTLDASKREEEETAKRVADLQKRREKQDQSRNSTLGDLIELYGEEMIRASE